MIAPEKSPVPAVYDRRRNDRIAVNIPIRIVYDGSVGQIYAEGVCNDLSELGMAFHTLVPLYVGEVVAVEFRQPGAEVFRCLARLLYKMGDRYGADFMLPG